MFGAPDGARSLRAVRKALDLNHRGRLRPRAQDILRPRPNPRGGCTCQADMTARGGTSHHGARRTAAVI
eukprot:7088317-Pyramimonas_sp.AAC.1